MMLKVTTTLALLASVAHARRRGMGMGERVYYGSGSGSGSGSGNDLLCTGTPILVDGRQNEQLRPFYGRIPVVKQTELNSNNNMMSLVFPAPEDFSGSMEFMLDGGQCNGAPCVENHAPFSMNGDLVTNNGDVDYYGWPATYGYHMLEVAIVNDQGHLICARRIPFAVTFDEDQRPPRAPYTTDVDECPSGHIQSNAECDFAAEELGFSDTTSETKRGKSKKRPFGCYFDDVKNELRFNVNPDAPMVTPEGFEVRRICRGVERIRKKKGMGMGL